MKSKVKINEMRMVLDSRSVNEGYARVAVSSFAALLDPTVEEINDIRTIVSEAVTNCIVHAYESNVGKIYINCAIYDDNRISIRIRDTGCGIEDVERAMEPLYTTKGEERSGLGFAVMESFSDRLRVRSHVDRGTTVYIDKYICGKDTR